MLREAEEKKAEEKEAEEKEGGRGEEESHKKMLDQSNGLHEVS